MQYPPKLTILAPLFRVAVDDNKRAFSNRLVFLPAFAMLHAVRGDNGHIAFCERVEIDPTGDGSIYLLTQIGSELDADATLGGWRLDRQVASFIRLPRDSERECEGKAPLMRFGLTLANQPIDVAWFDREGGLRTLEAAAARHGLVAQWRDQQPANLAINRQRLSARARSVWATIADKLLEQGDARRKAFACFDQFNSKGGGMK